MTQPTLKAPFPYFGGKSKVASLIWSRIGNVRNYVVPFVGSAADLLARPHAPGVETINDEDCYVANFWRATASEEGCLEVAMYADHPVSEVDLHARHRYLVLGEVAEEFRHRMRHDPEYFDTKFAGWWAWGMCCWIGGGWCTAHGETSDGGRKQTLPNLNSGKGVSKASAELHTKRPALGSGGKGGDGMRGVNGKLSQQIPDLSGESGATGRGLLKKLPVLTGFHNGGKGVNKPLPQRMPAMEKSAGGGKGVLGQVPDDLPEGRPVITDAFSRGRGVNSNDDASTCAARLEWLIQWFMALRDRMRTVRVCCGDWIRICDSDSTLTRIGGDFRPGKQSGTGVLLDPPYSKNAERMKAIVAELRGETPKGGGLFGDADLVAGSSNRADALYSNDKQDVDRLVARVHVWCAERGKDSRIRIALCGYEGEHDALEELGWECVAWQTQGGYGNRKKAGGGENTNKDRERIWFSPACLPAGGGK